MARGQRRGRGGGRGGGASGGLPPGAIAIPQALIDQYGIEGAIQRVMAQANAGVGGINVGDEVLEWLRKNPPPWAGEGGASASDEPGVRELVYVTSDPRVPAMIIELALLHLILETKQASPEVMAYSNAGGHEALLNLLLGRHPATSPAALESPEPQARASARSVKARAGGVLSMTMAGGPESPVVQRLSGNPERVAVLGALLGAVEVAWRHMPCDARNLGYLLDAFAVCPCAREDTFALVPPDGPNVALLAEILRRVVGWGGPYPESEQEGPVLVMAADSPTVFNTRPQRAFVAVFLNSALCKAITGGPSFEADPDTPAFLDRLRALLPRIGSDFVGLLEVILNGLQTNDLGPNSLIQSACALTHHVAALVKRVPELPEAQAMKGRALAAGERLKQASPRAYPYFKAAWSLSVPFA